MAEESGVVFSTSFSAYGIPLEMMTSFKYLGRVLLVADDEWLTVVQNVVKVRTVWWRMSKILSRKVARLHISGFFLKFIIQSVLLFDAESWVVTPHMIWYLRGFQDHGFQDHMERWLTGRLS